MVVALLMPSTDYVHGEHAAAAVAIVACGVAAWLKHYVHELLCCTPMQYRYTELVLFMPP